MIRCLLIDDEAPARLELRQLLSVHPDVEIVGEAASVHEGLALTAALTPDLVFLDIQLRAETGFDFIAHLPASAPGSANTPRIIFVTAHDQHAIRAFECNALDYLLKPVHPARLAHALRRVTPPPPPALALSETDRVFIKSGSTARFVPWSELLHIETEGNYTRAHLVNGTSLLVLRPLKEWLELAPPAAFLQVHRTSIVRRAAIRQIRTAADDRKLLVLANAAELPVGRSYWPIVKATLARS